MSIWGSGGTAGKYSPGCLWRAHWTAGGEMTEVGGCIGAVCIAAEVSAGCGLARVGVANCWTSAMFPAVIRVDKLRERRRQAA